MKVSLFLLCTVLLVSGCGAFTPYVDQEGKLHTKFGDTAQVVSDASAAVSKVVPLPVGGLVAAIGGFAGMLGLAVTSIMARKKEAGALEAVIRGVEEANNPEVKAMIRKVAGDSGSQPYLRKMVARYTDKEG